MIEAAREGDVDGAFIWGPVAEPELDSRPMFRKELALVAAAQVDSIKALLGSVDVRIRVLGAGCSYRQRLAALFVRLGVPSPRMPEFGTLEAIFACAGARFASRCCHASWPKEPVLQPVCPLSHRRRDGAVNGREGESCAGLRIELNRVAFPMMPIEPWSARLEQRRNLL